MAVARELEIIKTSVARMPPNDWRSLLDGYSQRLEEIGKRVDLPISMRVLEEIPSESYRMFPQGKQQNKLSRIVRPKLMHFGFPQELVTVHALVMKQRYEKDDTLDKA